MDLNLGHSVVSVSGDPGPFRVRLSLLSSSEGRSVIHMRMESEQMELPPFLQISWVQPALDIQGMWDSDVGNRNNYIGSNVISKSTSQAPVVSMFNSNGLNRLTFAYSDALNPVKIVAWIDEYTAAYNCSIQLFTENSAAIQVYESQLLLDHRDISYQKCISEVTDWWASFPGYEPAHVPEDATMPVYSTWYSFHQDIDASEIEKQCRLAKEVGCDLVIVDDGWQTTDSKVGYTTCGDWEVAANKIPNMNAHVEVVHKLGMKYLLWFSMPFVGRLSKAWSRFENQMLGFHEQLNTGILDPRFPDVREYLIESYEKALLEWNLDGFKLDFVDYFVLPSNCKDELGNGRDCDSIPVAVDRLMSDLMSRLKRIKPNVMIEFRQSYIGPLMRKYGNIFRVMDCPNDIVMNRLGTVGLRLLSGNTAVHSDMLMWNASETVECAALPFIHSMFGVPQISVRLDRIPDAHIGMIRHWLAFWKAHRDVLLHGNLIAERPDLLYPAVMSMNDDKLIAASYADCVLRLPQQLPPEGWIVNGTRRDSLSLQFHSEPCWTRFEITDCLGNRTHSGAVEYTENGYMNVKIPPSGMIYFNTGRM